MKIDIYGWKELKKYFSDIPFSKLELSRILLNEFSGPNVKRVSIIFVDTKYITNLNREFSKNGYYATDVLSFVIEESPLEGEIYICPSYIAKKYGIDEILRDIVHGLLHLLGEDHSKKFNPTSKEKETMFVKQENMLQNILYEINNRSRKSR